MMRFKLLLHRFFRRLYFEDSPGFLAKIAGGLLKLLVPGYIFLRFCDYRIKTASRRKLSTPVVSIGNLSVGGTGKTAFVLWLVKQLENDGYNCAVLKRGQGEKEGIIKGKTNHPDLYGDETALVNHHFPNVPVGVGADRWQWGQKIENQFPELDIFILDDGFQHYRLARELDLVLIGSIAEIKAARLPAGPMRESVSALDRADFLSLKTGGGKLPDAWKEFCATYVESLPMGHYYDFKGIWRDDEEMTDSYRKKQLILLSTLARPSRLIEFLENEGLEVADCISLPDHARIDGSILTGLDLERVVVTEKELVKLPDSSRKKIGCLRSEMVVEPDREFLSAVQELLEEN